MNMIQNRSNGRLLKSFAILISLLFLSGCSTVNYVNQRYDTTLGKKKAVANVHQADPLPDHLQRVAFLPIHRGRYDHIDMTLMEENFIGELIKRNLFEVVPVTKEAMIQMFPKESYSTVEFLPTKLLSKLHSAYDIDGIIMVDVSYFNAYQPVGLGVKTKLLDGHTGRIVWAVDEMFDSSTPSVSNSARKFYKTKSVFQFPLQSTQSVIHSPNRFSKYVANSIFSTISLQKY